VASKLPIYVSIKEIPNLFADFIGMDNLDGRGRRFKACGLVNPGN